MGQFIHASGDPQYVPERWQLEKVHPLVYRSVGYVDAYHIVPFTDGWRIYDPNGDEIVRAISQALHPTTVHGCEWMAVHDGAYIDLRFHHSFSDTSKTSPVHMETLGMDFFMHHKVTKPIWFINPEDGNVTHSGSKRHTNGRTTEHGKRYCSTCGKCFSSNNWCTQHMANCHPHFSKAQDSLVDIMLGVLEKS